MEDLSNILAKGFYASKSLLHSCFFCPFVTGKIINFGLNKRHFSILTFKHTNIKLS